LLRLAVIGAGRMGRVHIEALREARRAEAVAVADPVAAAREATGLPGFATVGELLTAGVAEAVLIAAPTDLHGELVAQVAAAGLPILCEKPLGLTVSQAEAAVAAAGGVLLQIGYWRRFVPELVQLKRLLDGGELGAPQQVLSHQWDEQPPGDEFRVRSGGIAIDMAVHEIDQIRWLLGEEFGDVHAVAGAPLPPGAPPGDADVAVATARLSGGTVATITLGRRFPPGDSCWLELFAADAHVRAEFMFADPSVFTAALAAQADAFASAVEGGPQEGATGADAVAALRVAERIKEELT
jgi:myo-inositol 2-dehydrogenase/D-chiro-inositol 1-dehydrogenase